MAANKTQPVADRPVLTLNESKTRSPRIQEATRKATGRKPRRAK